MKYYLYISDAKVDMLIQQIPHEVKQRIATEFKFDLKILGASRKAEREMADDRISRLETVCEFIHSYGNVGTVENPDHYISDTLDMRWHTYGVGGGQTDVTFVYFCALTDRHVLGLGGSVRHLMGYPAREIILPFSGSLLPPILCFLSNVFTRELPSPSLEKDDTWMRMALKMTERRGPQQRLEFLAKTLTRGIVTLDDNSTRLVTLATPLYVAMVE
jgi:hypothetical protein